MNNRLKKIEKRSYKTDENRPRVNAGNFSIKIVSNQKQHLKNAVNMLFDGSIYIVEQYKIEVNKLILSSNSEGEGFVKFPFSMNEEMVVDFIWNWLSTSAVYGDEPDHDGSNSIGFFIHNHNLNGKDLSNWDSRKIIVETIWLIHGK